MIVQQRVTCPCVCGGGGERSVRVAALPPCVNACRTRVTLNLRAISMTRSQYSFGELPWVYRVERACS